MRKLPRLESDRTKVIRERMTRQGTETNEGEEKDREKKRGEGKGDSSDSFGGERLRKERCM